MARVKQPGEVVNGSCDFWLFVCKEELSKVAQLAGKEKESLVTRCDSVSHLAWTDNALNKTKAEGTITQNKGEKVSREWYIHLTLRCIHAGETTSRATSLPFMIFFGTKKKASAQGQGIESWKGRRMEVTPPEAKG